MSSIKFLLLILLSTLFFSGRAMAASCPANPTNPSVTICAPPPSTSGSVTSPVHVVCETTDSHTVVSMKVYLDFNSVAAYSVNASSVDTNLNMAAGSHHLTCKAWDNASPQQVFSASETVSVTTASPVTVSPNSATLTPGQQQQFTASASSAVTWTATGGTIDASGLYTAGNTSGNFTVTATDSSGNQGRATVTINPAVTVSPSTATVVEGGTQQFTATASSSVTWTATGGTIDSSGLFTAGNTPGTFTVTATDTSGNQGHATVTVQSPVVITPSTATVQTGGTQQFTANVSVTWSASCGTISSSGLYTAPATAGTCTVTGTDSAGHTGTATVTVTSAPPTCTVNTANPSVTICSPPASPATVTSPVHAVCKTNDSHTVIAMKIYVDGIAVFSTSASSIDTQVTIAAGSHKFTCQAWDNASPQQVFKATETIQVGTGSGPVITPSSVTLKPGATQQFSASTAVTWSASCGTITSSGLYTAPSTTGTCTVTGTATDGSGSGTATVTVSTTSGRSYTTYKNDNARTGQQRNETTLTPSNVNSTTFGEKFADAVDGRVYAQPLVVAGVSPIAGGTHNVVYVATENDSVYAFDADAAGAALWHKTFLINGATTVPQANVNSTINPIIGITSTPVIDLPSGTLFVVAETLEAGSYVFRLHALDIHNGAEKNGGPVRLAATGFTTKEELQRGALLLANGNVYIAFASQGDTGTWQGWVFAYNAGSLSLVRAWNADPSGLGAGIWNGGTGPSADSAGDVYVSTGNGKWNGTTQFGDSFVKLDGSLDSPPVDFFTPFNQATLQSTDGDLGSGGILVVPDQTGPFPHELIGCGKPNAIYVVNRDNMGHLHSGVDSQIIQELPNALGGTSGTQSPNDHCFMTAAYWQQNLYFVGNNDVIKAFHLDPSTGKISTTPTSKGTFKFLFPGAQPVVSSNGSSNGIVWVVDHSASCALHAYNAANMGNQLYQSPGLGTGTKWATPTVVNGKVYVGTASQLVVFGLK